MRTAAATWSAPDAGARDFLGTKYYPDDDREALDSYLDRRLLEGTIASSMHWQLSRCVKSGYQATEDAGDSNCRSAVGNVACTSLDADRAGFERRAQKASGGVERQMNLPAAALELYASGLELDEAMAKAGVHGGDVAKRLAGAEPSAGLARAATGKSMRLATSAGSASYGMAVAAAYRGGQVVSAFAHGAPTAYIAGRPADTPAPGAKPTSGAAMYVRSGESGYGPTTFATAPASAALFASADSSKLNSVWRRA